MAIDVSESLLRAIATKDKTISDGRSIARKGAYKNTKKTEDGTLLWGECQGSALYTLSIDLAGDKPIVRCTCPVKPPPCKHTLGFLVYFMEQPAKFKVAEAPAELLEKRGKATERAEKRAEAVSKPRAVNKEALTKKTAQQREALDLLEKLVLDVATSGLGTIDSKRAGRLAEQAKQMTDAYLPGAAIAIKRLASLATAANERIATADDDEDEEYYGRLEPGGDLPEEERRRLMVRHLTRLWAMVRRGQKHLDEKLDEGESQSDADAVVEELLGRVWQLVELKEKNYSKKSLELLELAYERYDDQVREERIEQSFLVDLGDGTVFADRSYRPFQALERTKSKESFEGLLAISEAAVYPGFVNRRIRWELAAIKARDPVAQDWGRLHAAAQPVEAAFARYKEQVKNPLAPDDAVLLVRARDLVKTDAGTTLVDEKGTRLVLKDSPLARFRTTGNLELAAGSIARGGALEQPASLLVRLWLGLSDNAVYGQPLALVVSDRRIRLGL